MNEDQIKSSKIESVLLSKLTCDTLKRHILRTFNSFDEIKFLNLEKDAYAFGIDFFENLEPLKLYNSIQKGFWINHNISSDLQSKVTSALEEQASAYCIYSIYPAITPDITEEIQKLKKIRAASQKLRKLLPAPNDELFALIKIINGIEIGDMETKVTETFFDQLNQILDTLEKMYSIIPQTAFGQLTKVNSTAPQGNIALRGWILSSHLVWTEVLGRNLKYDGSNGINGPARFTDFAFEALSYLHPEIEHSQVEYAVRMFRNPPENRHEALRPINARGLS